MVGRVQEQGQEHFCPGVGPRTSARGDYPKVGGQEFPLAPHRGEMGANGAPRGEAGRPRSEAGGARSEEGGAPPEPSPPASLASETLSSYCEPWGQVSQGSEGEGVHSGLWRFGFKLIIFVFRTNLSNDLDCGDLVLSL